MGIATVAVHSTADSEAMHVRLADESVCIGPPASPQSYLNIPALSRGRRDHRRRRRSIRATVSCPKTPASPTSSPSTIGITFIGPKADHIRLMGDKIAAKAAMKKLGVPVVPGSDGGVGLGRRGARDRRRRSAIPVLIKAAAGGGGRGMKVARSDAELASALSQAAHRGAARLRRRCRLHRKISGTAAPYRDPDPRRLPWQCRPSRRTRLLVPAPPPEGAGRGAVAGTERRRARPDRPDR